MQYHLATLPDVALVRAFFARNLLRGNDAVYSDEFYCPFGIKAAIQRKQMFLAKEGLVIAAAARFYPKKNGEISLYQFAVEEEFRGQNLARALFDAIRSGHPMRSVCPLASSFNGYYEKTGWLLAGFERGLNQWILEG